MKPIQVSQMMEQNKKFADNLKFPKIAHSYELF